MILYHGSTVIVNNPDVLHSEHHLDFGTGFYVTSVKEKAERWAKRKAMFECCDKGIISVFEYSEDSDFIIKDFGDDLETWIDFVCDCRNGSENFKQYDIIKGKVADDRVFRVVDMYKRGIWEKERAIKEMKVYETYAQIAFITQKALDSMLKFKESYEV
jgi:hypothetical protein